MAKIIRLTEQDLYRIVKRVIMENQNGIVNVIADCIKANANLKDAFQAAEAFIKCDKCRRIVWLTGLQVFENMITGGEIKLPTPTEIINAIKIVIKTPEVQDLIIPCAQQMFGYYQGMTDAEKTELKTKMGNIVSCIVSKIFEGQISPIDLPLPDGMELPDGFPTQFPIPGEDGKIPGMDDMINTGIDIFNKTKDKFGF